MKKLLIVNLLYMLGAWCRLSAEDGTDLDRAIIIIALPPVVLSVIVLVCREVRIRKNLKQMREEKKKCELDQ